MARKYRKYILVSGSRYATPDRHWEEICRRLGQAVKGWPDTRVEVVVGDADGLDALARRWCDLHGIRTKPGGWKADWSRGKKAGPERNDRMVSYCADQTHDSEVECIAFPAANTESRGTVNCIRTWKRYIKNGAPFPVPREFKIHCDPAVIRGEKERFKY